MKKHLIEFFYFSRPERRGIVVVLALGALGWLLPDWVSPSRPLAAWTALELQWIKASQDTLGNAPMASRVTVVDTTPNPIKRFRIDPHQVDQDELVRWGVPLRLARTWVNYVAHGGRFFETNDLRKLYGMTDTLFAELAPWIILPDRTRASKKNPGGGQYENASSPIDINQADSATWTTLRGIGPVLARRIVRFRDRLGGFSSIDQVGETYGLPDSVFQAFRSVLVLQTPHWGRIPINSASIEQLAAHPYCNYRQARAIVAYRETHQGLASPEELWRIHGLDSSTVQRLLPYVSLSGPPLPSPD
ncbi:MAG: helix-hairpin-helix domain-containing protein [Lewinellaceae bacterium]|nr:helix-hairpin-helix domain-containing protein [Lewinellaceae bacterium]